MIHTTHTCGKCGSPNIVRNGHNRSGSPQYKCKDCGTCRVLHFKKRTKQLDINTVSKAYQERNSYRSIGRIFGISHVTVYKMLKKPKNSPLSNPQ